MSILSRIAEEIKPSHLLEEAKRVSPLAYKFQYVIEKPTEYDHHPDFFRQNDFKPGYDTFNNKERAEEMLYFMREDARLLEKLVKRYRTKLDEIRAYEEDLGLHKLLVAVRKWDLTKSEREALESWGAPVYEAAQLQVTKEAQ